MAARLEGRGLGAMGWRGGAIATSTNVDGEAGGPRIGGNGLEGRRDCDEYQCGRRGWRAADWRQWVGGEARLRRVPMWTARLEGRGLAAMGWRGGAIATSTNVDGEAGGPRTGGNGLEGRRDCDEYQCGRRGWRAAGWRQWVGGGRRDCDEYQCGRRGWRAA